MPMCLAKLLKMNISRNYRVFKPLRFELFRWPALACCLSATLYTSPLVAQNNNEPAVPVQQIDERQLFLPKSYRSYFIKLQQAAILASQTDRCVSFLRGELQRDLSQTDHPVFKILCRGDDKRSFAYLVDGLSLHLLDETRPEGSVSFAVLNAEIAAERERQRILEEQLAADALLEAERLEDIRLLVQAKALKRIEDERQQRLWEYCVSVLKERVRNMHALDWLTTTMPEPIRLENTHLRYHIDFNAQDLYKQPLRYRAECSIGDEDDYKIVIRPR